MGLVLDGVLVASVERKSLVDLVASLTGGKPRYQVAVPIVSAKPAGSPRNGPTATSPPTRPGLSPNILPCNVSHPATRSSPQTSMGHPPRRNPAPPRSAPGPAASAWPCPTAADYDPKSGKPGATRTASPEAETIQHTHNVCQVSSVPRNHRGRNSKSDFRRHCQVGELAGRCQDRWS